MSEFGTLIKEAFMGDEAFVPVADREALEVSVHRFERRMQTVRRMTWIGVTVMFAVVVASVVAFFRIGEPVSVRSAAICLALFVWGNIGIAMAKLWFATTHDSIALMKELKRGQIMMLELSTRGSR
jgi:hypothetical protein